MAGELVLFCSLLLTAPPTDDVAADSVTDTVQRALAHVEEGGLAWQAGEAPIKGGKGGCVSCHVITFTLWSEHEEARGMLMPVQY